MRLKSTALSLHLHLTSLKIRFYFLRERYLGFLHGGKYAGGGADAELWVEQGDEMLGRI